MEDLDSRRQRIIGVDGGGTKTLCVIGDGDGRVLAVCQGDGSNVKSRLRDDVERTLSSLFAQALEASGSAETQVSAVMLGLAGSYRPQDQALMRGYVASRFSGSPRITVCSDAVPALAAGTWGEAGMVVIAGTGSIAYGYCPATGRQLRAGGWGYWLGDEGSGFDLGRQALQAVARGHDGRGPGTALTPLLLEALGLQTPEQLIDAVYEQADPRKRMAALATYVVQAAADGDAVAAAILAEAAQALAELAYAVHDQWQAGSSGEAPPAPLPVTTAGGVLSAPLVYEQFAALVHSSGRGLACRPAELPPALGAYVLALREAGRAIDDNVKRRVRQAAQRLNG